MEARASKEVITSIARYLIVRRLSGDEVAVLGVKEYLVDNESPSAIAFKYKTSKFKIRGHIQRVINKAGNYRIATKVVESLYPHIMSIEPIMLRSGGTTICTICYKYVALYNCVSHVLKKHRGLIDKLTHNITQAVEHE